MDHTSCRLRLAAIADAPAILEIYAQYMDTPITFERSCRPWRNLRGASGRSRQNIRGLSARMKRAESLAMHMGISSLSARRTVGMRNFLNIWTVG